MKDKEKKKPKKAPKPKKVTSKDVPGDGMAKKAAKAIEKRRNQRQEIMKNLFGG